MTDELIIGGHRVASGELTRLRIPVARRYTATDTYLPVWIQRGKKPGPCLFVSAAVHGDEINGVEIIRRLVASRSVQRLRGTLIAVPIVNVYGFLQQRRYLPDNRDLNRSFPGSHSGSLASRLARTFMDEVVSHATHGIDLHSGANHRANLPQIRASLNSEETLRLSRAFGAPVIVDAPLREGSLREAVQERNIPLLVYEAGEALRFDELGVRAGVRGILNVMRALEMLSPRQQVRASEPYVARSSTWVRAPESGIINVRCRLGQAVKEGDRLATISDPLGEEHVDVLCPVQGVIIGMIRLPLANEGDALFHIASFQEVAQVAAEVAAFNREFDPMFD